MPLSLRLYAAIRRFFLGANDPLPWLIAATVIGALPYLQAMIATLSGPFTIDDDARQLVFWMVRWGDPALFRNDLIADYFASVSPPGFRAAYWLAAQLGIDPVLASKIFPTLLNAVMTVFAFRLGLLLSGGRVPAAFLGAVGLAFLMAWSHIIISGTPRGFGVPLLMVFLYYLARRRTIGLTVSGALVALTYPPATALGLGALGLTIFRWRGRPRLDLSRATWVPILCAGGVGVAILLVAALDRPFGPITTAEQVRSEPMFRSGGRMPLFDDKGAVRFRSCGGAFGVLPIEWCQLADRRLAAPILLGLLLLALIWAAGGLHLRGPPGERPVDWGPITRLLLAGAVLYGISFILLPKLHVPSRYALTPLRLVGLFGATMLGVLLAERALRQAGSADTNGLLTRRQWAQIGLAALTVIAFAAVYPLDVARRNVTPRYPAILAYLREQPKSALVAGMHPVTSNIPAFARRRVLVAGEYAIPLDRRYITRYRAGAHALIDAQYTSDPAKLVAFLRRYRVSHLVLDPKVLTPAGLRTVWWRREHASAHRRAAAALERGDTPALQRFLEPCTALKERGLVVVTARCIIDRAGGGDPR
ncbi:MAG: hypothetical protein P8Z76_02950 [Alphaproteobacteria bacterium]